MKTACITTVCTDDRFQYYIPIFLYSAKRAYPNYPVLIYLRGRLDDCVRDAVRAIPYKGYRILENQFLDYPHRLSMCNALRFVLGEKDFPSCDVVYFTDIDFIITPHKPALADFYYDKMKEIGQPCLAARGPITGFHRPEICAEWNKEFTRIAAGVYGVMYPDYFKATKKAREKYRNILHQGASDEYDRHPAASYREYDEVMLYRILKDSGLKTPRHKYAYINKEKANSHYRSIHIGDFKTQFRKRFKSMSKMMRILSPANAKYFQDMDMDKSWKKISGAMCEKQKSIHKEIRRIRKHCIKRGKMGV